METVLIEETIHSNPEIIKMKVDLELSLEKDELKEFKHLRIRENMTKDHEFGGMWYKIYFIKQKDKVVGFLSLAESTFYENLAWLSELYIVPEYRQRKVGSTALSIARKIVIERGFDYFGVRFAGEKRKKFYSKNGFNSEMSCVNVMEV